MRAAGFKPGSSSSHSPKAGELRLELRAQVLETCRLPLTNSPEMPKGGLEPPKAARAKWATATRNCRYPTSAKHGIQLSNNKRSESFPHTKRRNGPLLYLFSNWSLRFRERESAPAGSTLASCIGEPVFCRFRGTYGIHVTQRTDA